MGFAPHSLWVDWMSSARGGGRRPPVRAFRWRRMVDQCFLELPL